MIAGFPRTLSPICANGTRSGGAHSCKIMKTAILVTSTAFIALSVSDANCADLVLVEKGRPRAEIVVAEKRARMTTLAAIELRLFVEKMSGARLPIVTTPTVGPKVKIHIGKSKEADRLGVTAEGLRDGAYRIVSGEDWMVLIGRDDDFDPSTLPWPVSREDIPRAAAEWDQAIQGKTDAAWTFPFTGLFKGNWNPGSFHKIMTEQYGDDFTALWQVREGVRPGFWNQDADGSLQAVYGLLRRLGVRWYMAGALGEIVPKQDSIVVGPMNETVKPDYSVRAWSWYNYGGFSFDDVIWARRIGMNSGYERLGPLWGPHGLVNVHGHKAMQHAHPEYYALIGGRRDTEHRSHGTACFSSEGLAKETVSYLRFLFDTYDLPCADIWPGDGLVLCQCEKCQGKTLSQLVWGFADRVARDVYQTHPHKLVSCGAYTSYVDAPDTIEKLSPNLVVQLFSAPQRPMLGDADNWTQYWARLQKWQGKVAPGNFFRMENCRYHLWGNADEAISYPVIHPRAIAKDLQALREISLGESGEQSQVNGTWRVPGIEHLNLYIQSRFLWEAGQDVDQVLDEYYAIFYGPAAKQMKHALDFAEQNLAYKDESIRKGRGNSSNVSLAIKLRFRDLLDQARQTAGDTVYGDRIQKMIAELKPRDGVIAEHREMDKILAEGRAQAPSAVGIVAKDLDKATVYKLKGYWKEVAPADQTTFRAGWDKDMLLFDIVCKDPNMSSLAVAPDIHSGDYVAISLEPAVGTNYQISINPDGAVEDWGTSPNWKSLAQVKTERGNDYWRLTVRIPVVSSDEGQADPNHRVAGNKPSRESPWFFNVGRNQDLGGGKVELQAFSPTGAGWNVPAKFGKLVVD